MYERMKAEIYGQVSQYAEERGMESLEEEDDYSMDGLEDNQAPMSEYEFKDMMEEFYVPPENNNDTDHQEHEGQQKMEFDERKEEVNTDSD